MCSDESKRAVEAVILVQAAYRGDQRWSREDLACAPGNDGNHLMLHKSRKPARKNSRAVRARSPSDGASSGVWCVFVFVGRHGIETVPGAKLLLNLSGLASQFICQFSVYSPTRGTCHMPPNQTI